VWVEGAPIELDSGRVACPRLSMSHLYVLLAHSERNSIGNHVFLIISLAGTKLSSQLTPQTAQLAFLLVAIMTFS
jgi:hypothetical protein